MLSVGTDLVEIKRMEKSLKNDFFLKKVFGEAEISGLIARGLPPESAAAAFAAKEAFSKAIGTGVKGFKLPEVELMHDDNGAPFLQLSGNAKAIADELGYHFAVSLTHTRELAMAVVVAHTF